MNLPDNLPPLPPVPDGFDRWEYRGTEWKDARKAVYATVNTAISEEATADNWSLQSARPMGARWLHYIEAVREPARGESTGVEARVCDLERQLAAATEEREQMGKQAHANACEAMKYRRQLAEARTALEKCEKHLNGAYSHTVAREECDPIEEAGWILLCELREALARIDERHPELANSPALPPSVGSGEGSTNQ